MSNSRADRQRDAFEDYGPSLTQPNVARRSARHVAADEAAEVEQVGYEWSPSPEGNRRRTAAPTRRTSDYVAQQAPAELIPLGAEDEQPRARVAHRAPPARPQAARRYGAPTLASQYELPPGQPPAERIEPQPDPDIMYDAAPFEEYSDMPGVDGVWDDGSYAGDCGGCGECPACLTYDGDNGVCGYVAVPQRCPHRMCQPRYWLDESSLFVGVHGFKGPLDLGNNGNFGFQEGINFAGPIWDHYGIGYQVGAMWTQSNLSGSQVLAAGENARDQIFLTAGLFHRPYHNHGWQFGAVFDWLEDRYYVDTRFRDVRAELSYVTVCGHEIGFWGAFNTGNVQEIQVNNNDLRFELNSQYLFFYRYNLCNGSNGRIWGGATGKSDGVVGGDFRVLLTNRWELMGGVNYIIPQEGVGVGGSTEESWNISLNLVWYPTRACKGIHNGQYRSLFPVANNSVMTLDLLE